MCNVPTKQKPYALAQNPPISYHHSRRLPSIPTDRHGSDHRFTQDKGKRRHPYRRQPWMLTSSPISPMLHYDHRPGNSGPLPQEYLPLVRSPQESHNRQGPSIHFSLRKGVSCQDRGPTEHLDGLPSTNGRAIRMKEPMDRAIPLYSHIHGP